MDVPDSDLGKKEMETITQQTSITPGQHVAMVRLTRPGIPTQLLRITPFVHLCV